MSDKLHGGGGVKAGRTSVSVPVELRKSADSTELTGKAYTDVTASYWRQGGTRTAITPATLSGPSASFSSGGFVEVDATNMPGVYRLDVPDAAFATGADWVVLSVKVSTAFVVNVLFPLETKGASDLNDIAATSIVSSGAITTSGGAVSTVTTVGTLTTYTGNTPQTGDAYARLGAAGAGLTALGDTRLANLDAAVTSRMASYTQPTGFLAATFPGTVASTTNITAGTISTVTTLTNLPTAPTDWITAASVKADAVTKVQAGLMLTSGYTAPDNTSITAIKAKTDNLPAAPAAVGSAMTLTGAYDAAKTAAQAATALSAVVWTDAKAAYLDAAVSSASAPTAGTVAAAVWNLATTGHTTSGTFGAAMTAAGSAGDPWSTPLPGSYGDGTAGAILSMLDVPDATYVRPVPTPPNDPALTLVDGYAIGFDGARRPGVAVTIALEDSYSPVAISGSLLAQWEVTVAADSDGYVSALVPRGRRYVVRARDLRLNGKTFTTSGATFDLLTLA